MKNQNTDDQARDREVELCRLPLPLSYAYTSVATERETSAQHRRVRQEVGHRRHKETTYGYLCATAMARYDATSGRLRSQSNMRV